MKLKKLMPMNKRGQVVSQLISGTGGLVITVVIILVITSTLMTTNLLSGDANTTAQDLQSNFTTGINNVAVKIPTILLIGAVVLLFGVLIILVARSKQMGVGGGGSL